MAMMSLMSLMYVLSRLLKETFCLLRFCMPDLRPHHYQCLLQPNQLVLYI